MLPNILHPIDEEQFDLLGTERPHPIPCPTISRCGMSAAATTMALAGVATGSMNAYAEHTVTGSIRYTGWMPRPRDWRGSGRGGVREVKKEYIC